MNNSSKQTLSEFSPKLSSQKSMFYRTMLHEAEFEFVVLSDTHFMPDPGAKTVEFESRRLQSARIQRTLNLVASLNPSFVVHLGDLVQEYPETETFKSAMAEALAQLDGFDIKYHLVAGNHDIGDKPDPTMPTDWVTAESLKRHCAKHGCSWYRWDKGDLHFIVLNSQIMNSELPEAAEQRQWLTADLQASAGKRIFIFMHLPPYLENANEAALGHYDNVAEPDRGWLLGLFHKFHAEIVFAGHSHFSFFDRIGGTRYFIATSTSFTRPGFSEIFSSCPPAQQGRNDTDKLGFYLVRIFKTGAGVHFIRTCDSTDPIESSTQESRIITRLSQNLPDSPLGLSLRHPLTKVAEVPIAFPSIIRQKVRNDYPLLSCIELGVQHIRIPAGDLDDPVQRGRLEMLRDEGIKITAVWQCSEHGDLFNRAVLHHDLFDEAEFQILGTPWPTSNFLRDLHRCKDDLALPMALSTVIPRERVPGKQHNRPRFGYLPGELARLNRMLLARGIRVDRVLCRVDPHGYPWDSMRHSSLDTSLSQIGAVKWVIEFSTTDTNTQNILAAEAVFSSALNRKSQIFIEPLVDFDRTMDITYGLLDRLCNPRPAFNVVRCLNTILFSSDEAYLPMKASFSKGIRILGLKGKSTFLYLFLPLSPKNKTSLFDTRAFKKMSRDSKMINCFSLNRGTYSCYSSEKNFSSSETFRFDGPVLVVFSSHGTSPHPTA